MRPPGAGAAYSPIFRLRSSSALAAADYSNWTIVIGFRYRDHLVCHVPPEKKCNRPYKDGECDVKKHRHLGESAELVQ